MNDQNSASQTDLSHYIDFTQFGDCPHIRDSRVLISDIAAKGDNIAELAREFSLTEAQILAALLYAQEHKAEIDALTQQSLGKCLVKIDDIGTFIKYVDANNNHLGGGGTQDGGIDIIDALVGYFRETHNLLIGRFTAHHFLHTMHKPGMVKDFVMSVSGRDLISGMPAKHDLTSVEVREIPRIRQLVSHLANHIARTIMTDREHNQRQFDQVIVIGRPEYVQFEYLKSRLEETLQVEVIIKPVDRFDF